MDITVGMTHEPIGDAIQDGLGASHSDFWRHGPSAFVEGFIEISQALAPATVRVPEERDPVALTEEQLKTLFACAWAPTDWARKHGVVSAQSWSAPAAWFAAYTGARRGETLALRWHDLDFEAKAATIRHSLTETKASGVQFKEPKSGKHRTIVLPTSLVDVLRKHWAEQQKDREVFKDAYRDDDLVYKGRAAEAAAVFEQLAS